MGKEMYLVLWLLVGLLATVVHGLLIWRLQQSSPNLHFGWVVLAGLVVYGYVSSVVIIFSGGGGGLEGFVITGFYSEDRLLQSVSSYSSVSIGLMLAQFVAVFTGLEHRKSKVRRSRAFFSQEVFFSIFLLLLIALCFVSFYFRYGGVSGFIDFRSYDLRRDAYDAVNFGGGFIGRFDIISIITASAFWALALEKRRGRYWYIVVGLVPAAILFMTGTRMALVSVMIVSIYLVYAVRPDIFKTFLKFQLVSLIMLLPFFVFWGWARNFDLDDAYNYWLSEGFSLALILPGEIFAGQIAAMTWNVRELYLMGEFARSFVPGAILSIGHLESVSLGYEFNHYLRGDIAPVYVVGIAAWAAYPLVGSVGIVVVTAISYLVMAMFFKLVDSFSVNPVVNLVLLTSLSAWSIQFVRKDFGFWLSGILQLSVLVCGVLFLTWIVYCALSVSGVVMRNRQRPSNSRRWRA